MAQKCSRISIENNHPVLDGVPIRDDEALEVRSGRQWERVVISRSKDKEKRWVLRYEKDPNVTLLAEGALVRRVKLTWHERLAQEKAARENQAQ